MSDPQSLDLSRFGRWEGQIFHFEPPLAVNTEDGGSQMRKLTVSDANLAPDVTRDDVVSAVLARFGVIPACQEPNCPDFGSTDFGEGTCPAEHAQRSNQG